MSQSHGKKLCRVTYFTPQQLCTPDPNKQEKTVCYFIYIIRPCIIKWCKTNMFSLWSRTHAQRILQKKTHLIPYNYVYILSKIYITRYLCTLTYIKYWQTPIIVGHCDKVGRKTGAKECPDGGTHNGAYDSVILDKGERSQAVRSCADVTREYVKRT